MKVIFGVHRIEYVFSNLCSSFSSVTLAVAEHKKTDLKPKSNNRLRKTNEMIFTIGSSFFGHIFNVINPINHIPDV